MTIENKGNLILTICVSTAVLLFSSCEKDSGKKDLNPGNKGGNNISMIEYVTQDNCGSELTSVLFAGKSQRAGIVNVSSSGQFINVTYKADPGWVITETHLSVTSSLSDVPSGEGNNPKTGLFLYNTIHDQPVTSYSCENIETGGTTKLYILAHAVVKPVLGWISNMEAFELSLPETATISVSYPFAGSSSYFTTTVTNGGILDGIYEGWCIDTDHVIYSNTQYTVKVWSSLGSNLPDTGIVEYPGHLDRVNWIINQDYVGKPAPNGEYFTFGDVQRAIWSLVEDNLTENGLGQWSQARVDYILQESSEMGEGFVPPCGSKIAVVLLPVGLVQPAQITIAQVTLAAVPAACEPVYGKEETAWAAGYDFGGNNWAKYFIYCVRN